MTQFTLSESDVIAIGDPTSPDAPIEVTTVKLSEGKVRLGFIAPTETDVHRVEVYQDILENGRRS